MDGTTDTPIQDQPPKKLSVDDFAAKIKAKYPEYAGVDNTVLTQKILNKYPDYSDKVDMPKKAGGAGSPHDFGMGYKPTPEDLKTKQDWKDFQNGLEKSPNGSKPSQSTEPVPGLQNYWNSLHPDEQKALSDKTKQSQQQHTAEGISATPAQQEAEYRYSQTPVGKIDNSVKYLAQKATKGGLQVLKGAAYLARLGTSSDPSTFFTESTTINKAEEKADKATEFMSKGDQSRVEDSKAIANLGGLAEFLPAAAAAEGTGGASLYLQGMGSGKETMDQAEKNGAKINPVVKNAFILGSGAVNGFLMGETGSTIFKSLGTSLKNDVVAEITTNAIKEAAGKKLTAEGFNNLLKQGAKTWQDKTLQSGVNYLENTKHAITNLAALNVADFALKKGVDATTDKPVFNETPGDLADQLGNTIKTGAAFGAAGSLGDATKLTPFSQYKNAVMDNLLHDSSDENIAKTKQFIDQHGTEQGWTPEEIKATNDHVDEIAKVTKTLPKGLPVDKAEKAAELVIGRNSLQKQLTDLQEKRKAVDPAMQDVISPQEQLLTDKVEQANDKLKDIATGSKTTYSRGTGDNDDLFFKTTKGKREEISESRYKLERAERNASAAQNSDGATQPLPNEPSQNAPGEPEAVGNVDNEETTNNQIINQSDNESKNDASQKGEEGQSQANAEEGDEKNGQDEKNGLKVTSGEAKTEPETTFKVGDDYMLANETGKVIRVKELPNGDTELKVKKADDTSETVVIPKSDNKTKVTNLSEIELSRKKELLKNIKNKFFREDELSSPTEKWGDGDGVYGLDHEREKASDNLRRAQNSLYNVNRNKAFYENMLATGKPRWVYKSLLKKGESIEDILKDYPKHITNAEKALKLAKKAVSDLEPSKRGVEFVSKKIAEGVKKGTISKESAELSNKLLKKNPELFKDLAIYITSKKDGFAAGSYRGEDALITLFKKNNKTTAVHEILHHTERFLPTEIRNGILNEWGNALHKELASLQEKIDNTTDSETINKLSKAIRYLNLADKMQSEADYQKKSEIRNELKDIFRSRIVPHKYYEFFSPSEWWAVNAAEKFSKSDSIGNSWISKAKSWYNELITAAKNVLGLNRTQQVERGLQQILSGNPLKEQKDKFLEHLGKGDDLFSDSGDDLFSDSEVKEYARLAFKDTNGDFKAFSKDLMGNIGEGIKEHIPVLFKELSSENKEKPRYSIKGEKITKLPIAEHVELNNILKSDNGITIQDLKDEHEERNAGGNQTPEATTNAETVQQPENDGTGNAGENRSGESPEGGKGSKSSKSKTTFKKPTVTGVANADVEAERGESVDRTHKTKEQIEAEGKRLVDSGDMEPDKFADDLIKKPRPVTAEEQSALRYHKAKLNNRQRALSKDSEANPENKTSNEVEYAHNEDLIEQNRKATEIAGNETGRALGDRQQALAEDYSRVNVLRKAKIANGGELDPKDEAELTARTKRIEELEGKLADREEEIRKLQDKNTVSKVKRTADLEERNAKREVTKASLRKEREEILADLMLIAKKARGTLGANKIPVDMIVPLTKLARNYVLDGAVTISQVVDKVYNDLKNHIDGVTKEDIEDVVKNEFNDYLKEQNEVRLNWAKKLQKTKLEKLKDENYEQKVFKKILVDNDYLNIRAEINREQQRVNKKIADIENSKKSLNRKIVDVAVKYGRQAKLASVTVLGKLAATGLATIGIKPVTEGIGKGLSTVLPRVSERSSVEGKISMAEMKEASKQTEGQAVNSLSQAYSRAFTIGMKDAYQELRQGGSNLTALYKERGATLPAEAKEFFGHLHSAIKAPIKRFTWEHSYAKRVAKTIRSGLDPLDPVIDAQNRLNAYKDGEKAIFMGDNVLSKQYENVVGSMEKSNSSSARTAAAAMRILLPFVKVPTNIALEGVKYSFGSVSGLARLGRAFAKGMDNLTPEEADTILEHLKKGSIGGAAMLIGFYNPKNFGGFYQQGKKSAVKPGDIRVGDVDVPTFMVEHPLFIAAQVGANFRQLLDKYRHKDDRIPTATMATLAGLTYKVPQAEEIKRLVGLTENVTSMKEWEKFSAETLKGEVEPAAIQQLAKLIDPKQRQPDRKKGFIKYVGQTLETGIPGLSKNVPEKKSNKVKLLPKD